MQERVLATYELSETVTITPARSQDLDALIDAYIASLDMRPRSKGTYRKDARYFLRWMENERIDQPLDTDVIHYKQHLLATKSVYTTAFYLTAIRSFFGFIHCKTDYPNIVEGIKNSKSRNGHRKDALSIEQAKTILQAIEATTVAQKRDRAIVSPLIHTGLRTVEVERANIEDLRTLAGMPVLYVWGKGRDEKDDYVKITNSVMTTLKGYLDARRKISGRLRNEEPLFTSVSQRNYGGRIIARSVSRTCKQSLRQAGYDSNRLTAHSLRHTAVTTALVAGAAIRDVQKMARHGSPLITERYAHNLRRLEGAAEDAIEAVLSV